MRSLLRLQLLTHSWVVSSQYDTLEFLRGEVVAIRGYEASHRLVTGRSRQVRDMAISSGQDGDSLEERTPYSPVVKSWSFNWTSEL
jgi:hypothetical protein